MRARLRKAWISALWIASDLMLIFYGYWLSEKYKALDRVEYLQKRTK